MKINANVPRCMCNKCPILSVIGLSKAFMMDLNILFPFRTKKKCKSGGPVPCSFPREGNGVADFCRDRYVDIYIVFRRVLANNTGYQIA